jgi:hypothetical protein
VAAAVAVVLRYYDEQVAAATGEDLAEPEPGQDEDDDAEDAAEAVDA